MMQSLIAVLALGLAVAPAWGAESPPTDLEPAVNTSAPSSATTPAPATAAQAAPASPPSPPATPRGARAQDRVELEATQVTGNRELPRVMYVVPWKKPDLGDLGGRPAKSLLDEVLAPVDRDVFRRENRYYDALRPDAPRAQ